MTNQEAKQYIVDHPVRFGLSAEVRETRKEAIRVLANAAAMATPYDLPGSDPMGDE